MKASKTLVCIVGESNVDFGMLKAKVQALVAKLEPPLNQAGSMHQHCICRALLRRITSALRNSNVLNLCVPMQVLA